MFKPIRKKINEIDHSAAEALLQSNRRGIIAMNGYESYPYAIPINYFYDSDKRKIYFHGAKAGHKVDALKTSDNVLPYMVMSALMNLNSGRRMYKV